VNRGLSLSADMERADKSGIVHSIFSFQFVSNSDIAYLYHETEVFTYWNSPSNYCDHTAYQQLTW